MKPLIAMTLICVILTCVIISGFCVYQARWLMRYDSTVLRQVLELKE